MTATRGALDHLRLAVGVVGSGIVLATGLSACGGPTRSAVAVCHVWKTDAVALHNKYVRDAHSDDGFAMIIDLIGAPNDLATLMDKMAAVAPDGIEPDFKALANGFHQESQSEGGMVSDPLGGLASGLVSSLALSGSEERVNNYIDTNCAGAPGTHDAQSSRSAA